MKTLVRTLELQNEDERILVKDKLNSLGFYVLTGPDNTLQVYVISESCDVIDVVISAVSRVIKLIWRSL